MARVLLLFYYSKPYYNLQENIILGNSSKSSEKLKMKNEKLKTLSRYKKQDAITKQISNFNKQ